MHAPTTPSSCRTGLAAGNHGWLLSQGKQRHSLIQVEH